MSSLDLLILPLVRSGGQDQPSVPGLYVASRPRRTARFRERDELVLYFTLRASAPFSADQTNDLLASLAKTYFSTSGSVTTAQRAVAEALNQSLFDRNLRSDHQAIGLLAQVVLRANRLQLAQSGPLHALFLSSDEAQDFHDPSLAGEGLGLDRTTAVYFSQVELNTNDALVLTAEPPSAWTTETLQHPQGQGPESLRRRLLSKAGPDLRAALLHAQPGTGQLRLLRPVRAVRPGLSQPVLSATPLPRPVQTGVEPAPIETAPDSVAVPAQSIQTPPAEGAPIPASIAPARPLEASVPPIVSAPLPSGRAVPAPPVKPRAPRPASPNPMLIWLGSIGRALGTATRKFIRKAGAIARQMLPDEGIFALPPATMAFTAIAVPLVVVTIAAVVYFQRGRASQYAVYFDQAKEAALTAQSKTDPQEMRLAWQSTVVLLDQTEAFQTTPDSQNLRQQAQSSLDNLDAVERLEFQPVLADALEETAQITRMVASVDELYLLNEVEGVVLRTVRTNQGYQIDPTFQCGPGPYGGFIVGAITDIAALPKGNDLKATIAAIDADGNLLYCIPGEEALARQMEPPDIHWGTPQGLTVDTGDLYILDPQTNAVWIYRGMEITKQPRLFFGEQIPPMHDVIDMAVNLTDLYLLHADGHLTTCDYSGLLESPTRCEDPATYTDSRPGRQDGALIQDASFTELLFAPPPDPSIYLLDPVSKAIYHLSVRLTLQRQYRSRDPLPEGPATAIAINKNNRTAFMAIGNQVYSATLP